MGKTKQQLIVDNNASFPNNNANYITPAILRDFNRDMIDSTVNQDVYTADSYSVDNRIDNLESWSSSLDTNYASQTEFNAYTQSNNAKVNALIASTASFATSAITASSLTTASFAGGTMTFTKGDGSTFGVVIPDVSGSTLPAGTVSGSAQISALGFVSSSVTASSLTTASFSGNTLTFTKGNGTTFGVTIPDVSGSVTDLSALNAFTASVAGTNAFTQSIQTEVNGIEAKTGSYATTGSNTFIGNQSITTDTNTDVMIQSTAVSGQTNLILDAFQNNVTAKGNLSFTNNGQFGGSGSIKFISSLNNIEIASDSGIKIGASNGTGNGIDAGNVSMQVRSGSLSLAPTGFSNTTASLSHISSSSGTNFVNLMFKNNSNNPTTVISGSNNIFTNPSAATAGFIRHIGGSHNLMLNSGSVPQISGSMLTSPSLMGNILSHVGQNTITLRGPVSASAYSINQNILMGGQLNFGTSTANSFDRATAGMSANGNALFNGSITSNAATTPLSASVTVTGNLVFGAAVTLNCFSSSILYASNVQNGGITVNNSFVPAAGSTAAVTSARVGVNTIYGIGHALNISGTNTSTTQGKQFYANILAGTFLSSSIGTGDNCNILATAVIGNSLIITGSTLTSTFAGADTANTGQGSLFTGRFNDISGTKDLTGETVFAVGTGTSNANRKTGLLIDSGSNTFVEGTLNVSGSSSYTGSFVVSGSTTITGSITSIVKDITITSQTASLDFNAGNIFQLTLVSGSTTRLEATNIKAGQTINLLVSQPVVGFGNLTYGGTFKFSSGNSYVPTQVAAAKDIVTFLTFADTTAIYGASVKNLV